MSMPSPERERIPQAPEKCSWVIADPVGAATKPGKRTSLQYKMQKLGIARN